MKMQRVSTLSLLAVGTLLAVASCDAGETGGRTTGAAGQTGVAGTSGAAGVSGAAGNGAAGVSGAAGDSGAAGTSGAAGDTGVAGTSGAAGTSGGAGTSGAAGTNGGAGTGGGTAGTTGKAGTGGGAAGTGGGTAGTGGGSAMVPRGPSEGCGKMAADASAKWTMHQIKVTLTTSKAGNWTDRVYYIDIPTGYDPMKPYPILFGGAGCGGAAQTNGSSGGFAVLSTSNANAIQIGLSYTNGSCFAQGGADNPEMPFFDAVLKEVEANYCVDKGRVFVGGYSSGGWLSYMLAFARGGVVRGISPAAGGIAGETGRPPDTKLPVAGLLLTGANDTANPATGATGSDVARDLMLKYNGCTGTDTVPWEIPCPSCACVRYTGCPAAYPVVRCRPPNQGHTDGGGDFKKAIWQQWMTLPM
jgi:poly(3-hydroxybutyrate) depolymerase